MGNWIDTNSKNDGAMELLELEEKLLEQSVNKIVKCGSKEERANKIVLEAASYKKQIFIGRLIIAICIAAILCGIAVICYYFKEASPKAKRTQFVEELYKTAFDTTSDKSGISSWTEMLSKKHTTGVDVSYKLIFSEEYQQKETSDEVFVEMLYSTLLGRAIDDESKANLLTLLANGMSRRYVYASVVNSGEFTERCEKMKIEPGQYTLEDARDKNVKITTFIVRCYRTFLVREPDEDSLNWWAQYVLNGGNIKECAHGILFSDEVEQKAYGDEEFVKRLYLGLFAREASDEEIKSGMNILGGENGHENLFNEVTSGSEFEMVLQ